MKTLFNSFAQAFTNIKSNFFRIILSILGIVIGVASLVGILSLIDGMEMFARDQISKTTSLNAINIHHELYNRINDVQVRKDSSAILFYDDLMKLKSEIKQDVKLYLRQTSTGLVKLDTLTIGVLANGTLKNIMPDAQLITGKFFNDEKSTSEFIEVVVSEGFVNAAHWEKNRPLEKISNSME